MKLCIAFDGKNFFSISKDNSAGTNNIDFRRLQKYLTSVVPDATHTGTYYYSPVSLDEPDDSKLSRYLHALENISGFFVRRVERPNKVVKCGCGGTVSLVRGAEVTMATDILVQAANNAFDAIILVAPTADMLPVVQGVKSLGKVCYVASWANGVSKTLIRQAYNFIDLTGKESAYEYGGIDEEPYHSDEVPDEDGYTPSEKAVCFELKNAIGKFPDGFVGLNFFANKWRFEGLQVSTDRRFEIIEHLKEDEIIEVYEAPNGDKALRFLDEPWFLNPNEEDGFEEGVEEEGNI